MRFDTMSCWLRPWQDVMKPRENFNLKEGNLVIGNVQLFLIGNFKWNQRENWQKVFSTY